MENLKGKRILVKHSYMCLNAQTVRPENISLVIKCRSPHPIPEIHHFSSEQIFMCNIHFPEQGKACSWKNSGGKPEDLICSEQITCKISFDKLSEITAYDSPPH